jgi:hypothetical protein
MGVLFSVYVIDTWANVINIFQREFYTRIITSSWYVNLNEGEANGYLWKIFAKINDYLQYFMCAVIIKTI